MSMVRGVMATEASRRAIGAGAGVVAAAALLFTAASALYSPYIAYRGLHGAIARGDLSELRSFVNFEAVRKSLESQFGAAMEDEMGDKIRGHAEAAHLQAVGRNIVANLADGFSRPKAIVAMSRGTVSPGGEDARETGGPFEDAETSFGLTRFRIIRPGLTTGDVEFVLHRHGLFEWTLDEVKLPLTGPATS